MLGTHHPTSAADNRGTLTFADAPTERPQLGSTELWEFWNTTVDAHPVHLHLVDFRILNRQPFTGTIVDKGARWDPAELGPIVDRLLAEGRPPQKVYGT